MYHPKSIEHVKRLGKTLRALLIDHAKLTIAYSDCLDVIARMFGHANFKALSQSIREKSPSLNDCDTDEAIAARHLQRQIDVLVDLSVNIEAADTVIAALNPTGSNEDRKRLKREPLTDDEIHEIEEQLHGIKLGRFIRRCHIHYYPLPPKIIQFFHKDPLRQLAAALVIETENGNPICSILTHLNAYDITFSDFFSALPKYLNDKIPQSNLVIANFASRFISERTIPPEIGSPFAIAAGIIANALNKILAKLDEAKTDRFLDRFHKKILKAEAAGASLLDLASIVALVSDRHPLLPLIEMDEDEDRFQSRICKLTPPASGLRHYSEIVEENFDTAISKLIRHGDITDLYFFPLENLNMPVLRCDNSFALAGDLFVLLHEDGITPADLADAIDAVFDAQLAVASASDEGEEAEAVGAGLPTALPGINADLAAFVICTPWEISNRSNYVKELRRLSRRSLTLLDLCAHWISMEAQMMAASDDEEDDPMIKLMDEVDVFLWDDLPSVGVSNGFVVLAAALDGNWSRQDDFEERLAEILKEFKKDDLSIPFLRDHDHPHNAQEADTSLDFLRNLACAADTRDEINITALIAGLALGFARFNHSGEDEITTSENLSATELAYEALDRLVVLIQDPECTGRLNDAEREICDEAMETVARMFDILVRNTDRMSRVAILMANRHLSSFAPKAANDNPIDKF